MTDDEKTRLKKIDKDVSDLISDKLIEIYPINKLKQIYIDILDKYLPTEKTTEQSEDKEIFVIRKYIESDKTKTLFTDDADKTKFIKKLLEYHHLYYDITISSN